MLLRPLFLLRSAVTLALASSSVACFSCSEPSAQTVPDSGATQVDAGGDASRKDVDVDANPVDDAGAEDWSWLQGQWDPLPAPYDVCGERVARFAEQSGVLTAWKPCATMRAGCTEYDRYWSPIPARRIGVGTEGVVLGKDQEPLLIVERYYPTPVAPQYFPDRFMTVVETLHTQTTRYAQASWAPQRRCLNLTTFSSQGMAKRMVLRGDTSSMVQIYDWQTTASTNVPFTGPQAAASGVFVGTSASLLMLVSSGPWLQLFLSTKTISQPPRLQGLDGPRPVRTGFISRNYEAGRPILHIAHNGTIETLLTTAAPRYVSGYAVDHTDNERLVWVEGEDALEPTLKPILYTSPWGTSEASLAKRRVTAFQDPGHLRGGYINVANGHALILTSVTRALLIRLSDGAQWTIDADPGYGWATPIWSDPNEVWLVGGPLAPNGFNITEDANIYRIQRSTLGAPTPAE